MARTLPKTDVVIVGGGWTGLTNAYELCHEGLECVVLERGQWRHDSSSFAAPEEHDELKYGLRYAHMMNTAQQTLTFRNKTDQRALPMRRLGSFLPGQGLGGAGIHWNGQQWRFLEADLNLRSHYLERYGQKFLDDIPDLTIQDYGISWDEIEPHHDFFEKITGCSGQAGNIGGETIAGGNVFEGPRSNPYPNPPMKQPYSSTIFARTAADMGYHPFPFPSANVTRNYTNPYGAQLHPCTYCGYCERFGCGYFAKADPIICVYDRIRDHPNLDLRFGAWVQRVEKAADGKTATGVTYIDDNGEELFQPADLVLMCSYSLWNVHLLLNSGLGEPYDPRSRTGVVGRNYAYQTITGLNVFYDREMNFNPFMGAGALGMCIDDFNTDNFDHSGLGFVGGGYISCKMYHGRPISWQPTPEGTPAWGAEWKKAVRENYNSTADFVVHMSSASVHHNYLDLDPTYTDMFGRPLLRMTFDFPENDKRMSDYISKKTYEIAENMGGASVSMTERAKDPYSIVPYQTTHNTGGAVMGTDPATSVVNRYGQMWDASNVFVFGACLFPQNLGYNPTGPLMALAYWEIDAIKNQYLSNPGPLMGRS